jgi:hypothetical protein
MSQKWKIAGIVLAFIGLPVLYTFEVDTLNRTIHASRMMMIAAAIGLLVGILLGYRFQKPAARRRGAYSYVCGVYCFVGAYCTFAGEFEQSAIEFSGCATRASRVCRRITPLFQSLWR